MSKISIIGAGKVGGTVAFLLALKSLGDIFLIDINGDLARGRALDIMHCAAIEHLRYPVVGSGSYEDMSKSDIVIITAGMARLKDGNRDTLLDNNLETVRNIAQQIVKYAPNAFVIVVTNPVDVLTWVVKKITGFPTCRIAGMAGALDSARMNYYTSIEAGTYPTLFSCTIMGNHGEYMTNVMDEMKLDDVEAKQLIKNGKLQKEQIANAYIKTVQAGGTICKLTQSSTMYAPASAITSIVYAHLHNLEEIIPCSVYLEGEYGVNDLCIGVPAVIGIRGV